MKSATKKIALSAAALLVGSTIGAFAAEFEMNISSGHPLDPFASSDSRLAARL